MLLWKHWANPCCGTAAMSAPRHCFHCAQLFANWGSQDRDVSQSGHSAGYAGRSFPSKRWEQGGRAHAGPPPGVGRASDNAIDDMFKRENWGRMSGGTRAFGAAFGNKADANGRGFQEGDEVEKDDETFGDDAGFDTSHEGVVCARKLSPSLLCFTLSARRMHRGKCSAAVQPSSRTETCIAGDRLTSQSLSQCPA